MEFNINDWTEIKKLATIVRRSGYYNQNEPLDSVTEKVAYILATSNVLEEANCRSGLVGGLVWRLNKRKEFRETFTDEANCHNYWKECNYKDRDSVIPKVRFMSLESFECLDDNGDSYNPNEPECPKSNEEFAEQMRKERTLWTHENLMTLFVHILGKNPEDQKVGKKTREVYRTLFNKTFKTTWFCGGEQLMLYKRTYKGIVLDMDSPYFGKDASFIHEYIERLNQNIARSDHWRTFLRRFAEEHGYTSTDWEYPMYKAFKEAYEALEGEDKQYISDWLNYEARPTDYAKLKLLNQFFTRVHGSGSNMLFADERRLVSGPEWYEIELLEE